MKKSFWVLIFALVCSVSSARAQTAEVTIQLNEQFFDALLDAVFKNANALEFPLAANRPKTEDRSPESGVRSLRTETGNAFSFASAYAFAPDENARRAAATTAYCPESIRLQREIDGVRTAVRFRDGRILTPIAFRGNYNPPLIGCVEFAGVAETNIDLEFDANRQALVGRARVANVNLSGAGGVGGSLLARLVQNSIDRRINPIEIIALDRVSFVVPIQNAGALRMKAAVIRHEIANGVLNVRIVYEFQKAE